MLPLKVNCIELADGYLVSLGLQIVLLAFSSPFHLPDTANALYKVSRHLWYLHSKIICVVCKGTHEQQFSNSNSCSLKSVNWPIMFVQFVCVTLAV
jgi:hypothetical protein